MSANESSAPSSGKKRPDPKPYMQNRELSWLTFNERVLDQGADPSVPLLARLNFISIFWSNLQEFFMVRVGSLTDLSLVKTTIYDSKTGMTPAEQLIAIYDRCRELYPLQMHVYEDVRAELRKEGIGHLRPDELSEEQTAFVAEYMETAVLPFLSPQIVNARHPFPHLENGALYVLVRLDEEMPVEQTPDGHAKGKAGKVAKADKGSKAKKADVGAEGVTLGLIPLPRQCERVIQLPGEGFQFILLEHVIEMFVPLVFGMYNVKHTNIICVTRNADLDATEGKDESDEDYREHMKRILKKRGRLAPVRLESERPLSSTVQKTLLHRLGLKPHQVFTTPVPLDLSYTFGLGSRLPALTRAKLSDPAFSPQWPDALDRSKPIMEQVRHRSVLESYPYESMDPFVKLLREAAYDPDVISIKITLYRLARQSHLAEALIDAAEAGKDVTALFELRARFDESNNIEWSQRFEEAGCRVIYGFRDYKVHSKICCITRRCEHGVETITQLGTGNYNEKTAKLYTDFSYLTADPAIGRDAQAFFRNMALETISDAYTTLWVAPLQIKRNIIAGIEAQIAKARAGEPSGLFFKTNSVTDKDIIEKIVEASQAGVPTIMLVRGISCIVPGARGYTENVRVVSIVGQLLEHSRVYGFGPIDDMRIYLSSADLMTRNMDKRIEVAWPITDAALERDVTNYLKTCLADTAKLRELRPDGRYTPLGALATEADAKAGTFFDSQQYFITHAGHVPDKDAERAPSGKLAREDHPENARADAEAPLEATREATAANAQQEEHAAYSEQAASASTKAKEAHCEPDAPTKQSDEPKSQTKTDPRIRKNDREDTAQEYAAPITQDDSAPRTSAAAAPEQTALCVPVRLPRSFTRRHRANPLLRAVSTLFTKRR